MELQHSRAASNAGRRKRRTVVASLAALAVAGAGAFTALATSANAEEPEAGTTAVNGYRNVAYFTQWGVYGRDYQVKDIVDAGIADELTHINYAFGNIHHETLECFEANKAQGEGPNGSDGAGDAYADYGKSYTAAESVSGVADSWDQPLAGSFNQLKQLKEQNPDLKVMISLGGWTWSKNFSLAAATPESRANFVSSCVDQYIKGNLPVIDGRGGEGAAAGVFDGFDIDWEWPGSQNGAEGNHVDPENDAANFKALLAEFRSQLDAYGAQTGEHYELSAFLPANPEDIAAGGWNDPEIFDSLDFGNLQGYDLHGAWDADLTGHQGNLYPDPADPREPSRQFSIEESLAEYTGNGVDPAQLTLGMAMYGRGWTGATRSDAWGSATGAAPGTYEAGNEDYDILKNLGTEYFDEQVGAAWRYDGTQWWSLDTPQSVTQKARWIKDQGLSGAMWWELSGDETGDLPAVVAAEFGSGDPGPDPTDDPTDEPTDEPTDDPTGPPADDCTSAPWDAAAVYTGGDTASHGGHEWEARWWTQGETPGGADVWADLGACSGDPGPDPTGDPGTGDCPAAWTAGTAYTGGDEAEYGGHVWRAKWWTQGDTPGAGEWGPWEDLGAC
ncbi:glycosyl hydrolase family 18 protein [Myceligenerans xiligouense]|uniref:chitinase n=1 Tax=Myceligenerans xiligouense TaxID=253184 RepID=A0A3N4ZIL0_9MICO|nr:glycosyl hydrolase family 18 protein [Myceligenerans xiligouense]RPF19751.1 chitinase [Myceligenerans xiligouense]